MLAGAVRAAAAQDYVDEEEPAPVYVAELRTPGRAVLGLDFGIGVLDAVCSGCYAEGGVSLDFFAGVQVARRAALVADGWALTHLIATDSDQSGIATLAIATAGPRVWLAPRFWIQGGVGGGWLLVSGAGSGDGAEFGPGAMLAAGGEPGHKRCSGIDLSLRMGGIRGSDDAGDPLLLYSIAAVVGYHWN